VPLGQSSLAFTIMGESGKSFTKADTAWHHLVVSLAPTGTFSVTVDAIGVQSAGSSAPPDVLDLTVGLFDVSAGTASAPTDVQIDNVLVRSL
jgi:hypothetical protein